MKLRKMATPDGWKDLPHHPDSNLCDFGAGIDLNSLAEHMKRNGYDQNEPIILIWVEERNRYEILDGRHKHASAKMANVEPAFALFVGKDPLTYVEKKGLRQHLTSSQLAMFAAKLVEQKRTLPAPGAGSGYSSLTDASNTIGVSERTLQRASKVLKSGSPKLVEAVDHGEISVKDAADVAAEPPEVQNKAVADVKAGKAKTAAAAAKELKHDRKCRTTGDSSTCLKCKSDRKANPKADKFDDGRQPDDEASTEERMKMANSAIETWCRKLTAMIAELPKDPWLDDLNRCGGIAAKIRSACETARSAKGVCECPRCEGGGCKACHDTGWITRHAKEQLG